MCTSECKIRALSANGAHFEFCFWLHCRELHIEGDPTSIYLSASALVSLQKMYGRIPKIYGKGSHAQKVCELMKSMGKDELVATGSSKGAIDQLIILDRSIDLMSVLATQLTYEGLIGESDFDFVLIQNYDKTFNSSFISFALSTPRRNLWHKSIDRALSSGTIFQIGREFSN